MKKILVVEKDPAILLSVKHTLQFHGFEVFTYATGRDVISIINTFDPDLVLLGILLPIKSGIDICKEIKMRFDLPVVLFSANPMAGDWLAECRADAFIEKPFDIKNLVKTINTHVNHYQKIF